MRTQGSKILSGCWLLIFTFLICFTLQAQSGKGGKPSKDPKPPKDPHGECEGNCFTTQVIKAEITGDCCTEYTLRVSHDGTCRYDLSHFTVALPCGTVESLSNSRNWKQEIGKDPTTGLRGFKIDDIPNFGKTENNSFTVNVKVCSDSSCLEKISVVAYKAGQCVDYDTLRYNVTGSCGNNGGGGDTTTNCSTLAASMKVVNASCFGAQDGRLEVEIQDGKRPIQYKWSNGSTDSVAQNLSAGTYFVTISDAAGNVLTLSKAVAQSSDIVISQTTFNPSCGGSANGFIDITVSGGSGMYTYAWSNGATTQDISNLNAGLFTVTVTDSSGCSKQASYMLVNNVRVLLSGTVTKASCGQTNGGVNASVSGGTAPYTYSWDNGASTEDLTNVGVGTYRLTVTDANGCSGSSTFVVNQNNTVTVSFAVTPAGCFNETTGAIDITASGGTAPYTYSWQHGPTTEDLTGLVSGIYRITVTDNAGCSVLTAINVPKKSILVNALVTQPRCNGDTTGSIVVVPIDGSTTYTYLWSNGETGNSLTNVPVGNYSLTITDASGCSRTLSYTITEPAALTANASVTNNNCGAEGSFSIDLTVTGGKTPYTYLWSTGAITQDLQGLNSGTYSVQIKDSNNCTSSKEVVVTPASNSFSCKINPATTPLICNSVGNTLSAVTTDAQSYQWNVSSSDSSWAITSGSSSPVAVYTVGSAGSSATFSLTIQKDGCTKTCSYTVATSCVVRDNTGGGDPSSSDPCSPSDSTGTVVVSPPQPEPPVEEPTDAVFKLLAYPNPFVRHVTFEWVADKDDFVRLDIIDLCGRPVERLFRGRVQKGEKYIVEWEADGQRERMYTYKFTTSTKIYRGKLFRKH